jgi:apolipoprotein N-acyltransferase
MALYVAKYPGREAIYWGYHEWMHVLIVLGFLFNMSVLNWIQFLAPLAPFFCTLVMSCSGMSCSCKLH